MWFSLYFLTAIPLKKTQMWSQLCFALAFNFLYLTFAHFFFLCICCLPAFIYVHFFLICSFSEVHFFCLWALAAFSQLSNMKQLLAWSSQLGKPSLWLFFSTGGSNPKLWFPSICLFQVLSPLPSTSPTISILLLNLPLFL